MKNCALEPEIEHYAPESYKAIIAALKTRKIKVLFYRVRKKLKKKRMQYLKHPVLNSKIASTMDLLVVFSPYATSHKAKKYSVDYKVPMIHLELGFLPKSILCDIGGFWGESALKNSIGSILDQYMNDSCYKWSEKYSRDLQKHNISKRKQPTEHTNIKGNFIFLPMQYMNDQSVLRFGNIKYPRFVHKVASFCAAHKIKLAIKKHPHAYRKEPKNVNRLLKEMKKKYGKYFEVVDGSIHWFCKHCVFMAGMNTGAIVDGLVNNCVISHCGESIFMNSGAVVHNDKTLSGLSKCLNMIDSDKARLIQRQKALLYFLYNHYLLLENDTHNSKESNTQKVLFQLDAAKTR